jgi:tetratricopeptide (TPR) repeat protein
MRIGFTALAILISFAANAADLSAGTALFDQKKYAEANTFFEPLNTGKDPEVLYYLGRIAVEQKQYDAAEGYLLKATQLAPDVHRYVLWLGKAYGSHGREANLFTKGLLAPKIHAAFERAVELKPDDIDSRRDLVSFYLEAPGFLGGSYEKAREQADAIAKLDAIEGARAYARIARTQERQDEAYAILKKASDAHPENVEFAVETAIAAQGIKRWDDSFAILEAAIKRAPEAWGAWYQIGRTAVLSGQKLEHGAEALEKYIAAKPTLPIPPDAPHNRLGQIYEKLNQPAKARAEYEAALKINAQNKDAAAGLQRVVVAK